MATSSADTRTSPIKAIVEGKTEGLKFQTLLKLLTDSVREGCVELSNHIDRTPEHKRQGQIAVASHFAKDILEPMASLEKGNGLVKLENGVNTPVSVSEIRTGIEALRNKLQLQDRSGASSTNPTSPYSRVTNTYHTAERTEGFWDWVENKAKVHGQSVGAS